MSESVRLTTRAEVAIASYDLGDAQAIERIVEHGDFVVAFRSASVDVFRFVGDEVADRCSLSP